MAVVKRLVAPDEEGGRRLGIEQRPHPLRHLLGPILRRAFGGDPHVVRVGRGEHLIGVLEASAFDAVDPDDEGLAAGHEGCARRSGRADEIGDGVAADVDHLIAQPTHAAGVLQPIRLGETQVLVDVGANFVGVQMDGVEPRCQCLRQRRLARTGKTHDQNLAVVRHSQDLRKAHVRYAAAISTTGCFHAFSRGKTSFANSVRLSTVSSWFR